ncbi:Alpha-L-arabinofuranosidase C precursor [Rubripirellula lacrimiformis]|uniref:non-reducing end alpha-L-arabinofuranosidase n=1 Tax=Rubripirellula lacrimiformis TaxID=1930273 RepID=A0A517NA78_9BACT|nr:non-reducing end alpha-L-arabinofuranosidase family hydrolase [Rubripirellula lacrimiformis]QDT04037.1 Alpha-L-arabinofuranosidase C precursor [Rubripirellula lacrimiformis]
MMARPLWLCVLGSVFAMLAAPRSASSQDVWSTGNFRWQVSAPLIRADADRLPPADPDPWIAVKDPSVVRYNNRWHVFCTLRNTGSGDGRIRIGYIAADDWANAGDSDWQLLDLTTGYHGAPQIFYFEPESTWYLIYQAEDASRGLRYGPCFSTNPDITNAAGWTRPQPMMTFAPGAKAGLDYWVICDQQRAHLFFTSLDGRMWRSETALDQFPANGWSAPVVALQTDIFEASHTYRIQNQSKYVSLIEAKDAKRRYFKAFVADRLDGKWRPLADSPQHPFASPVNMIDSEESWTDNYSHGELLRAGFDQNLEVAPDNVRFLFQGIDRRDASDDSYGQLPWQLGILTLKSP